MVVVERLGVDTVSDVLEDVASVARAGENFTCRVQSKIRFTTSSRSSSSSLSNTLRRAISPTARQAPCAFPSPRVVELSARASSKDVRIASRSCEANEGGRRSERRARYLAEE